MVMLPGLDGTGILFKPLIEALPANIKPIVVSYPTDQKLGYDDLLSLVMKALPKNEPFILLGESFGGPLSILVADSNPNGLKGVILCATFVTCPQKLVSKWTEYFLFLIPFRASVTIAKINGFFGEYYSQYMHLALSAVKPEVFRHRLRELIKVDVKTELFTCKLPMLYLQGKQDWLVPSSNFSAIKKLKPDIQLAQLETSHMVLQTKPNEAASLINKFIENIN